MEETQSFSVEDSHESQAADTQTLEGNEDTGAQQDQTQDTPEDVPGAEGQDAETAPANAAPQFPEKLAPFKTLLESRKWDPANPDILPEALKAYTELESAHGRAQTERKHVESRAEFFSGLARADVDTINKFREKEGLPPIAARPSLDERVKETETLVTNLNKVLTGTDTDGKAFADLNAYFAKVQGDLDFEKRYSEKNPGKSQQEVFTQRKSEAQSRYADVVAKDPTVKDHIDALTPHFSPGGLFYGMGLDVLDIAASNERLEAFSDIGKALHLAKNFDKIVQDKVKTELERRRTASNRGTGGKPNNTQRIAVGDFDPLGLGFR